MLGLREIILASEYRGLRHRLSCQVPYLEQRHLLIFQEFTELCSGQEPAPTLYNTCNPQRTGNCLSVVGALAERGCLDGSGPSAPGSLETMTQ